MPSILFIDDDIFNTMLAKNIFAKLSILEDVAFANNGEEALRLLTTNPLPTRIFLDQNMPLMNGSELLENIINKGIDITSTRIYLMIGGEIPSEFKKEPLSNLVHQYTQRPLTLKQFSEILDI